MSNEKPLDKPASESNECVLQGGPTSLVLWCMTHLRWVDRHTKVCSGSTTEPATSAPYRQVSEK